MAALNLETPEWALPLLEPARYKAAHGGRGGGKSHLFAENVVERCLGPNKLDKDGQRRPVRIVCIREVQNSIKDSVKQLIVDKITAMGVAHRFNVIDTEIRGPNDSLIIFKGMHAYNAANIKSLEGYDIAWVEEAQTLSEISLRMLRPTIRKEYADGTVSELWFTWNPRHETDAVDHFFRGNSPLAKGWRKPTDAIIIECNWPTNPWLPAVLRQEKDDDYATDPDMAEHVWGGGYERVTVGAYFAKLIANLERIGRIGSFPYDPALGPVYTSWDLGVDDYTAIWFFQVHQVEHEPRVRIVDYFQFNGEGAQTIIPAAMPEYTGDVQDRVTQMMEIGRDVGFKYQRHFFPHDLKNREWGNAGTERILTVVKLGVPSVTIAKGVATDPENRINATRDLLPMCEFNNSSRVMIGISCLRRYQRKIHQQLGFYMGPQHDETSHGADAFGEFAINCGVKLPEPKALPPTVTPARTTQGFQLPPNRSRRSGMRL
ncbi:MAG: PBSX family phage terminase large subunit [Beijerinckiaceae bacterium]